MKIYLTFFLFLTALCSFSQGQLKDKSPIQVVNKIFNEYKTNYEGVESTENKVAMKKALLALQVSYKESDLQLLINVWLYYDPTDFPTREFVEPIFYKNKKMTLKAIDYRLAHKLSWEIKLGVDLNELKTLQTTLTKN